MVVPALWGPMRCNWQRMPVPPLLPRQAATMKRTSTRIGAGGVIDYREAQFEKVLREKVDVVFDLVGGDAQKRSFLDVATVYALQDAAQVWKDIAEKLP